MHGITNESGDGHRALAELLSSRGYERVTLVTTKYPPYPAHRRLLQGGVDFDLEATVRLLRLDGFTVRIVALDYYERMGSIEDKGVERIGVYKPYSLIKSPIRRGFRFVTSEIINPLILYRLLKVLRRNKPDVIILGASLQLGLSPYLAAMILRIPLFSRYDWFCPSRPKDSVCGFLERITNCGECLRSKSGMPVGKLYGYVIGLVSGLIYIVKVRLWKRCEGMLAVNEFYARQYEGYGVPRNKIMIIRPARSIERVGIREDLYRELNGDDALKVLFVGRLDKDKGIELLLDCCKSIFESRDDIRLLVAGDGAFRSTVEKFVEQYPQADYLGWLEEEQLSQAYQVADVVVIPSLVLEGHPLVAEEAISFNKTLVAFNRGGLKEILDGYQRGIPVERVSSEALADALMKVLAERKRQG